MEEKTIVKQLEDILSEFCDDYCKFPQICKDKHGNDEDAAERALNAYCEDCPLLKIL